MNFIPGEQQRRHAVADDLVTRLYDTVIGNPEVQDVLGSAVVQEVIDVADTYYVPNKRGMTYMAPKGEVYTGRQPIVPVGPNERHRLHHNLLSFHPQQAETIRTELSSRNLSDTQIEAKMHYWRDDMQKDIFRDRSTITLDDEDALLATVIFSKDVSHPDARGTYELMRFNPVLLARREAHVTPDFAAHEVVHIMQAKAAPIVAVADIPFGRERFRLQEEIPAYDADGSVFAITGEVSPKWAVCQRMAHEVPTMIEHILGQEPDENIDPMQLFFDTFTARRNELRAKEIRKAATAES